MFKSIPRKRKENKAKKIPQFNPIVFRLSAPFQINNLKTSGYQTVTLLGQKPVLPST